MNFLDSIEEMVNTFLDSIDERVKTFLGTLEERVKTFLESTEEKVIPTSADMLDRATTMLRMIPLVSESLR